jgi:hypothetical protein
MTAIRAKLVDWIMSLNHVINSPIYNETLLIKDPETSEKTHEAVVGDICLGASQQFSSTSMGMRVCGEPRLDGTSDINLWILIKESIVILTNVHQAQADVWV